MGTGGRRPSRRRRPRADVLTCRARPVALVVLVGLALTACAPQGSTGGEITVNGRVTDVTGAPLEGVTVKARVRADLQGASARLNALADFGLACVDERPPHECADTTESTSTGDGGEFAVPVPDSEAPPGVIAGPVTVEVAVRGDAGSGQLTGASTSSGAVVTEDTAIGDVTLWEPSLEMSPATDRDAVLRWSAHPAGQVEYHGLAESSDGRLLWDEGTQATEVVFPAEALRGTAGGLSVVARSLATNVVWRSPRIPYVADDEGVRLAGVDDVGWPFDQAISEFTVLVAIVSLLVSSALLVMTAGSRHRRRLRLMQALPLRRWGDG